MDTQELAVREHENLIHAFTGASVTAAGSRVERDRGIALFAVPLPIRLFNQVLVERDDADADALAAAVGVMRERKARFIVQLRAGTDDAWIPAVEALGLVEDGGEMQMPGMAWYPLPPAVEAARSAGFEIRRATDAARIRDHVTAAAAGFGMPEAWLGAVMNEGILDNPAAAVYVGYADGRPVTSGMGYRTGTTIGVYNIATAEDARGRGYGEAITRRIVDDGSTAGCDAAILQASDMGYPIYERMGFRTVVEYRGWIDPEPAS